jgi:hypothetical protein
MLDIVQVGSGRETGETIMTILRNDPVRERFAGCTTNGKSVGYYGCKGAAVSTFESALREFGYCFAHDVAYGWANDDGRMTCRICKDGDEWGNSVGCALISWYRMPSGRYEFTGYIS